MTEENTQTPETVHAADTALAVIGARSFAGRHPELGKMKKCEFCGRRHRQVEQLRAPNSLGKDKIIVAHYTCVQVFSKDSAGRERNLDNVKTVKAIIGAAAFKGKRLKPPLNKRANELVQIARSFVPDEYTQEEMLNGLKRARRILAEKYGRFGFLPSLWLSRKQTNETKAKNVASETSVQVPEASVS